MGNADTPNTITVRFASWSNTQVVIDGLSGDFGQGGFVLKTR